MKEKNYAGTLALRVLDFATMGNPPNAEAFITVGRLSLRSAQLVLSCDDDDDLYHLPVGAKSSEPALPVVSA